MLRIYVACKMTGRDRKEQVEHAQHVKEVLRKYDIEVVSPVLEEKVVALPGPLLNNDEEKLRNFWRRDKEIIIREVHAIMIDGADQKSFGVEREYGLSRYCMWKPTVLYMPKTVLNVSQFEDDFTSDSLDEIGKYLQDNFGTRKKRITWRIKMLMRSLPKWIVGQMYQFR
jgi:hypothetical protein